MCSLFNNRRFLSGIAIILFSAAGLNAQETKSQAAGRVLSGKKEILAGATVTVIHEPTQSKYVGVTRNDGYFHLFNIRPCGPYSIIIRSDGYESLPISNLYIHLASDYLSVNNSQLPNSS